jgi:class 3 adenylate cyclase
VYLQPRGYGLSERLRYVPTLEQRADDVLAVMDAVGMRRATLLASLTTCAQAGLVAANAPDRVHALVLFKPLPCGPLAPNAFEHGWTQPVADDYVAAWRAAVEQWGSGATTAVWDSVTDSPYNRRMMALLERCSGTRSAVRAYLENALRLDGTPFAAAIRAPTRVLYSPTASEPEAAVRRVAELIPDATFHVLPRLSAGAALGETWLGVYEHLEEAATGQHRRDRATRFLGTVLFTDVAGSTELLARLGDAAYREVRSAHERAVRLSVESAGGRLVNVSGDGTFSIFDGPTKAVRCAAEIRDNAHDLGISVRAGVHTGELEREGVGATGLGVHLGARVAQAAAPDEVLVSRTVRDLVAGSDLTFVSRGERVLKGIPGAWELFALAGTGGDADALPAEGSLATPLDRAALRTARAAPAVVRAALRVGNAVERYRARAARR